jgi:F0F1-type ATP synthase epsilon subunit
MIVLETHLPCSHDSPIVSELQPGVVKIIHKANEEPEKFFVSAGFALTHANNVCDISAVEAVPVSNLANAYWAATFSFEPYIQMRCRLKTWMRTQ